MRQRKKQTMHGGGNVKRGRKKKVKGRRMGGRKGGRETPAVCWGAMYVQERKTKEAEGVRGLTDRKLTKEKARKTTVS